MESLRMRTRLQDAALKHEEFGVNRAKIGRCVRHKQEGQIKITRCMSDVLMDDPEVKGTQASKVSTNSRFN